MEVDQEAVSHVHFPEDQIAQHNSEIVIQCDGQDKVSLHLGFLQIHHHYEITVSIPDKLGEDLTFDPLQNLHLKVTQVMPSENGQGHDLILDFKAYKEKIVKEEVSLTDPASSQKLNVMIHARVLGKGKGTPALKTGIRCTGINAEYDSEQSDWQGFD